MLWSPNVVRLPQQHRKCTQPYSQSEHRADRLGANVYGNAVALDALRAPGWHGRGSRLRWNPSYIQPEAKSRDGVAGLGHLGDSMLALGIASTGPTISQGENGYLPLRTVEELCPGSDAYFSTWVFYYGYAVLSHARYVKCTMTDRCSAEEDSEVRKGIKFFAGALLDQVIHTSPTQKLSERLALLRKSSNDGWPGPNGITIFLERCASQRRLAGASTSFQNSLGHVHQSKNTLIVEYTLDIRNNLSTPQKRAVLNDLGVELQKYGFTGVDV
ncbi:hypothetical protein C8R45DRAFT_937273 [Mycena sanguinolenta]|nr:hypothetical protein C8R45DRAFT_937273 [Mycena sanguinolenta]